jgi:hypothetical protein
MKINLLFCLLILVFVSCKNEESVLPANGPSNTMEALRADFVKQTGYHQRDSNFLFQSFKTSINWEQNKVISNDTVYVKVNVLDKVKLLSTDSRQISIHNMVWIKAIKAKDAWTYTLLTFIPENTKLGYTGTIISKSILSGEQWKAYFIEGELVKQASGLKASSTDRKCTYGYVNGEINVISCEPPRTGTDYPGQGGGPIDYETVDPMEHGGAGGSSGGDGAEGESTTNPDHEIIDALEGYPCAQAVLAKLPNLENKISTWLNSVFKNNANNSLTFRVSTNIKPEVDGFWNYNNPSGKAQTISLNGQMLSKASQEYIAATFFHEALHGYLHNEKVRLEEEGKGSQFGILYPGWSATDVLVENRYVIEHSTMATSLKDLADAIKSFSPSMSNADALALAKAGIVSNMTQAEIDLNLRHRNGNEGTKCN